MGLPPPLLEIDSFLGGAVPNVGQVDSGVALFRGHHQLVARISIRLLMEVKAGRARFLGQANHAMPCRGFDPIRGRVLGGLLLGAERDGGKNQTKQGQV